MNIVNFIITNKFLASSLCFGGGYALNGALLVVNQLAVRYLGLPIDMQNGQEYNEFADNQVKNCKHFAHLYGVGLDRLLGAYLSDCTVIAVREEISYRYLLETIVLPCICPQFAAFSIARTCVSSLWFAAAHLQNNGSSGALAGQFLNTALLGAICSLAQHRIGLVGSVFVHVGFNLYGWQYMYNQNLADVTNKIKAIRLIDVIDPVKIGTYLGNFIDDALTPALLAYQGAKKIAGSFA
jgi:hypothetical protein